MADILHDIFSMPRSGDEPSSSTTGRVDATKLNAIHEMLRLPVGVAALGTSHPVCREYPAEAGGGIRRVFPIKGSGDPQECKYSQNMVTRNPKRPSLSKRSVGSDYFDCCVPHTNGPCLGLRTGYIENWRLGPDGDDV